MEFVRGNSKAAVPDTILQERSVSPGPSTLGAGETSILGAQFCSPSVETGAVIPASSPQFYSSPYSIENMSLALAESSTAPVNFFSSLPVTTAISCSSVAESQTSTSIYTDTPCFNFDPGYCHSSPVSLLDTVACSSSFPSTYADASLGFQRCSSSFSSAQTDILPVYASSESPPTISVSASRLQSSVQPQGTTAVSTSLRSLDEYCRELAPVSTPISTVPENPSLMIVANGTEDPTSLRLIEDSDDPTLLKVTDDLDDISASHANVLHSAEIPTVVEFPPQSSITAEELSSLRIPSETIAETVHPLPSVGVIYSSAHSEPPVGASTDLSTERSSSLPSTRPPSGTSTIMSPFIVELARDFPSQLSSSLIVPKIEPDSSPLLVPKLEPLDTTSGSAAGRRYFSVVMVPSSLDPKYGSFSACPDLRLYASSSEPSSPSCPSSSCPSSGPARDTPPECPELEPSVSPKETDPLSTSSLNPFSSDRMAASTSEAPSTCSPSSAVSYSNSLTSSPRDSGNGAQSSEPVDCSPSITSDEKVENSTVDVEGSCPGNSRKDALLPSEEQYPIGEYQVNSGPSPLPGAEVVPRVYIGKGQRGTGWPYAPQGWPNRDDKWPWRVGKRSCSQGYYKDRFLGLPISLVKGKKLVEFASKKAVVGFLKQNFPHLDVDSFFKAFQWRIPCVLHRSSCPAEASPVRGEKRQREADVDEPTENPAKRSRKQCRAGNLKCGMETGRSVLLGPLPVLDCDICCVEPGFCRECTCILCCKTIVPDAGECNLVRCMQRSLAGGICGHSAHLACALESQMAGVVKKRGLDMEYLCRRCDRKSDLRELVTRLLEAVGSTEQRYVAEKCLQLALLIMQGTEHGGTGARVLEALVQAALRKVQSGVDIQEVFSDLRDQGIAAEAAKHQCLARASSNGEDGSQQPEASLDQWLPSSGSPSSHPSPGTPSSFSSPIIRRNLSVNSPADGTEGADHGNHIGVDGHTDESGEAVRMLGSKFSSAASEPSSFKTNQVKVSSHRARAGSSSSDVNQEATCGSQAMAKNGKLGIDEPVPRSLNLGMKKSDHKAPTVGAGTQRDEHCRSCGARRPAGHGLEVTSSLKFTNAEDAGDKSHYFLPARKEGELTPQSESRHTDDAERETDQGSTRSQCTSSAAVVSSDGRSDGSVLGVSLSLLDDKCQEQVQSVLQRLRQAQQMEFLRAQERLIAQKDFVLKQYELLEIARRQYDEAEISSSYHLQDFDHLMLKLSNQLVKASEERRTWEKMFKVAQGFGKLSKEDLSKFFGWASEREESAICCHSRHERH